MKKNNLFLSCLCVLIFSANLYGQSDVEDLMKNFTASEWTLVKEAKLKLENHEAIAIGNIVSLLDRDEFVKLTNTGSLIYPGAEKIYGYGQIIEYSIDNLSIRAGWLLEDITFNNFGFTGIHRADEDLIPFIRVNFSDYYNNSNNRKKVEASTADELRRLIHKLSIKNAQEWWELNKGDWTRLRGLLGALKSFDEKRQVKVLFYILNGETKCSGLDKEYFIENISNEIYRLSLSDTKRVSEYASNILTDTKLLWMEKKNK